VRLYLKLIAQVIATVLAAIATALFGDGSLDTSELINVGILGLGAVAVLGAGNLPAGVWQHTKGIVSAATAVLVLLSSLWTDGISPAEWAQLVLAALGALGVVVAPGPVVYSDPTAAGAAGAGLRPGPLV
jgi:hypothetical protein